MDRKSIQLELGDIVHRHIMDGDFVLFNRQPSLHRMSMIALETKVMKIGDTFRFNVAITPGFNADYDGDYNVFGVIPEKFGCQHADAN
jgi:DNA-directed RNA polymerase II subunit RPB1